MTDEQARRARLQERFDQLSRKLDLYEETHAFYTKAFCRDDAADHLAAWETSSDLDLCEVLVWIFKTESQVTELTRELEAAKQDRDHARTQLQAIGRKSFWAARPRKDP
jgi:hypothetical protein